MMERGLSSAREEAPGKGLGQEEGAPGVDRLAAVILALGAMEKALNHQST